MGSGLCSPTTVIIRVLLLFLRLAIRKTEKETLRWAFSHCSTQFEIDERLKTYRPISEGEQQKKTRQNGVEGEESSSSMRQSIAPLIPSENRFLYFPLQPIVSLSRYATIQQSISIFQQGYNNLPNLPGGLHNKERQARAHTRIQLTREPSSFFSLFALFPLGQKYSSILLLRYYILLP